MSNTPVRVPQIKSEIAVAIAYLDWSLRQLADYSALIGQPIGEHFLEDALEESWPDLRSKADPVRVENLTRVLDGLGVGLQDDVFGVVPRLYTRMPAAHGIGPVGAVMGLVANYPKAQLRLAIQDPVPGDDAPAAALLIRMRGKPRPSDLVAQQALGEADELGRGRIARTPTASLPCF